MVLLGGRWRWILEGGGFGRAVAVVFGGWWFWEGGGGGFWRVVDR